MRFAILGTGQVGQAIGNKLHELGHDMILGTREPETKRQLPLNVASYVEAARHGEWIINALPGEAAWQILRDGETTGKILIDIANYDQAMDKPIIRPLGQVLQAALPATKAVKTLNCLIAHLMVNPAVLDNPSLRFHRERRCGRNAAIRATKPSGPSAASQRAATS